MAKKQIDTLSDQQKVEEFLKSKTVTVCKLNDSGIDPDAPKRGWFGHAKKKKAPTPVKDEK